MRPDGYTKLLRHSLISIGMIGCMPDTQPVSGDRRRQLAELILASSRRSGLGPGARLPTERQLAADLGTTRSSIRHALAVLQADGYISREVGRGTFLRGRGPLPGPGGEEEAASAARAGDGQPAGPAGYAPADVMAIRRLAEPAAMQLVVAWANTADFAEIDRCLAGAERADGYEEFESWDLALHRAIIGASHSPLLTRLYAIVSEARHGQSWGDLKRRSASQQRRQEYQDDHREIVAALRARDDGRAAGAMQAHLARVSSHLFGSVP
jgi:GntR family uxuAB operon transcriptional repressor